MLVQQCPYDKNQIYENPYLLTLPEGIMSFHEFSKHFDLKDASTEQLNPITKNLSQTMQKDVIAGLEQLLEADKKIIEGFKSFLPAIDFFAPQLAEKVLSGGRVFLVGSGSSGRIAIDIAAKCNSFFKECNRPIIGIIAGGDAAFIRAKEGFEDSEIEGEKALSQCNLGPKDTVILISASGSALFNVGCAHFAAEKGSRVMYFYNSKTIPARTQNLFKNHSVIPLLIDIGPQAIAGSTRLQAATLAEAALGSLLVSTLYYATKRTQSAQKYPRDLIEKLKEGTRLIGSHLKQVRDFVDKEHEIFSDPRSNFRQLHDRTNQGYVTFLSDESCIRELLIDTTETSPTFSTNPPRRESELLKKRSEFQAYLIGEKENIEAWESLLGRQPQNDNVADFLLTCKADGPNAYRNRPIGKGNFLIGVAKLQDSQEPLKEIMDQLKISHQQGGEINLILLCRGKLKKNDSKYSLILENVPHDSVGFAETILLKQILNLISNGSMILMNKVYGNQMIDVRASNGKLINRCMRLIKEIWRAYYPFSELDDRMLYHYINHVNKLKKDYEEKGMYTPSIVKIILAMLSLQCTPAHFKRVVDRLMKEQERIDWIGN